jgi:hypothetical protein
MPSCRSLVVGGLLGLISGAVTFVFFLVAEFVWLAKMFDPLIAGLLRSATPFGRMVARLNMHAEHALAARW